MDFPGSSDSKQPACNVGDLGWIPGLGRSPGWGHGNQLYYSCLENPHGQMSWSRFWSLWIIHTYLSTIQFTFHTHLIFILLSGQVFWIKILTIQFTSIKSLIVFYKIEWKSVACLGISLLFRSFTDMQNLISPVLELIHFPRELNFLTVIFI